MRARQELAHRAARDAALATLAFPHPDFRHGQRPLAEAVYKAASVGCCLLAQAPTPLQERFIQRFQALEVWEQTLLLSSLQRISAMMNADEIDAAPVLSVRPLTEERA
jgi:hypothetical protein